MQCTKKCIGGELFLATKQKAVFVCNNCGEVSSRWMGKCPACEEWNTLVEDIITEPSKNKSSNTHITTNNGIITSIDEILISDDSMRMKTNLNELDRVLGGGVVLGSVILLGGEPGAGKSTLLLQVGSFISKEHSVLYITGEESVQQIKLRSDRLSLNNNQLYLSQLTEIGSICALIIKNKPGIVIIDSIQTMYSSELSSSPGSVSQVKECTAQLLNIAKTYTVPIFIVGHVNKDGAIAGPKVMEHMVDTVLYFEGDKTLPYKILRAAKNRYGSTNEIGMFDMTQKGLVEISNPSKVLLEGRPTGVSGNCVTCKMEGTRPVLSEVQALIAKTNFGTPRRTTSGIDYNRANLLLAVIEKRAGYSLQNLDVYLNSVGGMDLEETASDLAIVMAIVSGLLDKPIDDMTVVVGEVGLGGEVRAVPNLELRLKEMERLGFKKAIVPAQNLNKIEKQLFSIEIVGVEYIQQILKL